MPGAERTYRVVNLRSQPVELHVGADAVLVDPGGEAEIAVRTRQVDELARRGLVAVEEVERRPATRPARTSRATPSRPASRSRPRRGGKQ